jgi:hypothetical protein
MSTDTNPKKSTQVPKADQSNKKLAETLGQKKEGQDQGQMKKGNIANQDKMKSKNKGGP